MSDYEKKICNLIKESCNFTEVAEKSGVRVGGNTYKEFKRISEKYKIDTSHFKKRNKTGENKLLKKEEVFSKDSKINSSRLHKYITRYNLKKEICECCGLSQWMGKNISLQVHHINGDNKDNRIENLQILCPNCHSQTDNYAGKNIKTLNNIQKIKKEENIKERLNLIHNSGVDFNKWGWVNKVAKICGTNNTKLKEFMIKYDYDFYLSCYNKETAIKKNKEKKDCIKNRKKNKLQLIENRKLIIINSGINKNTKGWQTILSKLIGITRQSLKEFIDKHMPEFYN